MKKNNKMQSKNITNKKVTDCNKKNVNNKNCNKVSNKTDNIGFENETKSFQLDDDDSHSFELK